MSRALRLLLATGVAVLAAAPPSAAYVAPGATILSASTERLEQADDTTIQVAIAGDGRYAVFTTRARNFFADDDPDPSGRFRAGGIFRRDLRTGALELVAHGDLRADSDPDRVLVRGGLNPSVSADGRYVAFSTGWSLTPDDTNTNIDVYVRDMTKRAPEPGAFELVSRTATAAARYAPPPEGQDRPGVNPGAEVTARSSISADGRRVAFRTVDVVSDLPAGEAVSTPGQQLFVRDLTAGTTTLVTRDRTTGEPVGGALAASVLSADGSTVAWVGRNAPAQTPFLPGEGENPAFEYYLWQRVGDGSGAPTRRVTGFVDPEDPACSPGTPVLDRPSATGPCYGPLANNEGYLGGIVNQVPALSADGRRVAYLSNSPPRGVTSGGIAADLFVTDMVDGVGRKATTIEVTRDGGPAATTNAAIDAVALSADGRHVALSTFRSEQLLPTLRLLGAVRAQATTRDLYLVDLAQRTIERASTGLGGADTDGSVSGLPALSDDGRRVVFTSSATNLFFGDANNRPDAFSVDRGDAPPAEEPAGEPPLDLLPPVVTTPTEVPAKRLVVRAGRGRNAVVALRVKLPEPGRGAAVARGRLRNADGKRIGSTRVLARTAFKAAKAGTVTVRVRVPRKLRRGLRTAGRLTASTQLQFEGRSGAEYVGRVTVEFVP